MVKRSGRVLCEALHGRVGAKEVDGVQMVGKDVGRVVMVTF